MWLYYKRSGLGVWSCVAYEPCRIEMYSTGTSLKQRGPKRHPRAEGNTSRTHAVFTMCQTLLAYTRRECIAAKPLIGYSKKHHAVGTHSCLLLSLVLFFPVFHREPSDFGARARALAVCPGSPRLPDRRDRYVSHKTLAMLSFMPAGHAECQFAFSPYGLFVLVMMEASPPRGVSAHGALLVLGGFPPPHLPTTSICPLHILLAVRGPDAQSPPPKPISS